MIFHIIGPSGSGKTTLGTKLAKLKNVQIIDTDEIDDPNAVEIIEKYHFKTKFNKISLVCHNGTDDGKRKSVELRYMLISQPGWILEASGASSWMLRKKNAPYFKDKDAIETALDIIDNPNDKIIINDSFDYNNKESHHYIRVYRDINNDKEYRSEETLFGTASCNYKTNDCARTCEEEVKVGGKPKRRSKKSRTRKKR